MIVLSYGVRSIDWDLIDKDFKLIVIDIEMRDLVDSDYVSEYDFKVDKVNKIISCEDLEVNNMDYLSEVINNWWEGDYEIILLE